jgi:hypothetical protein
MKMNIKLMVSAVIAGGLVFAPALAQQYVYPAKGQSPEQQKKDESECNKWAIQQSGYDPAKPPAAAPAAPAGAAPGSGVKGAARGAVVGGVVGNVGNVDSSDAARAGAVVGAARGRQQSKQQQQAAQQQQQASAKAAGPDAYNKARSACLGGRGYSVK